MTAQEGVSDMMWAADNSCPDIMDDMPHWKLQRKFWIQHPVDSSSFVSKLSEAEAVCTTRFDTLEMDGAASPLLTLLTMCNNRPNSKQTDPALVTVQDLTLLDPRELNRHAPFHLHEVVGLPDMHKPGHWRPPNGPAVGVPVVAPLSPFPSFNLPATSDILKAAARAKMMRATFPSKQQELLDKMRWQQQLKQSAVMVTPNNTPMTGAGGVALDDFVREAMRRVLYGY
ncbi:hypothetical protein C0Q70_09978 [Pomacea canaliculata]|uniref:Uncharacterized protein n=1 Tax=Pomacea canaliculata TaxID=400727 RepID=A0A2T7PBA7_POMCA|nr:hypothetical protein C0Q70_09978 [Pomacea canaliculata]